jgi:uncharacterized membrane protein HdeD (DUF308 family)
VKSILQFIVGLFLFIAGPLGMITHIGETYQDGNWLFLIGGIVLPPIGIIHGLGALLGVW